MRDEGTVVQVKKESSGLNLTAMLRAIAPRVAILTTARMLDACAPWPAGRRNVMVSMVLTRMSESKTAK